MIAVVSSVNGLPSGESQIEIRSSGASRALLKKSFSSPDGQNGEIIDKAQWTPDSKFFVFSMYNSGGHQPWYSPTDVYSSCLNKILPLDGPNLIITDPNFRILGPNHLKVFARDDVDGPDSWVSINLTALH